MHSEQRIYGRTTTLTPGGAEGGSRTSFYTEVTTKLHKLFRNREVDSQTDPQICVRQNERLYNLVTDFTLKNIDYYQQKERTIDSFFLFMLRNFANTVNSLKKIADYSEHADITAKIALHTKVIDIIEDYLKAKYSDS